ncbi:unnamed protein product, partial [Ectocarpus sp. 13 AM-2016]
GHSRLGVSSLHLSSASTATTAVGRCDVPDVSAALRAGTRGLRSAPSNPTGALRRVSVQAARSSSRKPPRRTVIHSRYLSRGVRGVSGDTVWSSKYPERAVSRNTRVTSR